MFSPSSFDREFRRPSEHRGAFRPKDADARELEARVGRLSVVQPADEQLVAMTALVAELRDDAGLPRWVTGVRRAVRVRSG
jgi:hypothetical protein